MIVSVLLPHNRRRCDHFVSLNLTRVIGKLTAILCRPRSLSITESDSLFLVVHRLLLAQFLGATLATRGHLQLAVVLNNSHPNLPWASIFVPIARADILLVACDCLILRLLDMMGACRRLLDCTGGGT